MYAVAMPDAENISQHSSPPLALIFFLTPPVGDGIDVKVTYSEHFEQ